MRSFLLLVALAGCCRPQVVKDVVVQKVPQPCLPGAPPEDEPLDPPARECGAGRVLVRLAYLLYGQEKDDVCLAPGAAATVATNHRLLRAWAERAEIACPKIP